MFDAVIAEPAYSANVVLFLEAASRVYPLSQISPTRITLRKPEVIPSGPAEVVMRIDDTETRWRVFFAQDAVPIGRVISVDLEPSDVDPLS